jgi:hypothetical protein
MIYRHRKGKNHGYYLSIKAKIFQHILVNFMVLLDLGD